MNDEERVKELVEDLSYLISVSQCGACGKSGDICKGCARPASTGWLALAYFKKHSDLVLIDREKERPKFYPRGTTGINPILPVQVNIPKVIKDLYDSYQPVISLAPVIKEMEDGH